MIYRSEYISINHLNFKNVVHSKNEQRFQDVQAICHNPEKNSRRKERRKEKKKGRGI